MAEADFIDIHDPATQAEVREAVRTLVRVCHGLSRQSGWWNRPDANAPHMSLVRLGLIHTEISEAFEAVRKDKNDDHLPNMKGVAVELGDALIRECDMAGGEEIPLDEAVVRKLVYNSIRQDHRPENRAKAGGKRW